MANDGTVDQQQLQETLNEAYQLAGQWIGRILALSEVTKDGELGELAIYETIEAAINGGQLGNLAAVQTSLGFLNVWAGGTVNTTFPNSDLYNASGVGSDIYFCNGTINDKPTASYGSVLHIKVLGDRAFQLFLQGYNSPGEINVYGRLLVPESNGSYSKQPWGQFFSFKKDSFANQGYAILDAIAGSSGANTLGSYVMAKNSGNTWHGGTTSGSNLVPCGIGSGGAIGEGDNGTPLTGTWRCMGRGASGDATMWLKVAD